METSASASCTREFELLGGFSPPFIVLVGLLLLALIGLIDAVTGAFAVTVFYLVPIGLVTFARGRWVGTSMAATAACAWMVVELRTGVTSWDQAVTYWNWLSRFYVYEAIVILVAPMRDVMGWERESPIARPRPLTSSEP